MLTIVAVTVATLQLPIFCITHNQCQHIHILLVFLYNRLINNCHHPPYRIKHGITDTLAVIAKNVVILETAVIAQGVIMIAS